MNSRHVLQTGWVAHCGLYCCLVFLQLDAGVTEQVLLQSRDERSLLVVSYADLKVKPVGLLQDTGGVDPVTDACGN